MKKKKKFGFMALVVLVVLSLVACSSEGGSEESDSNEKKELQVAYNAQPPTLDPLISTAVATRDVMRNVYETLLTLDENFEVTPSLAESYEQSKDGKTITFKLRKGIKFHNGDDMTADDVVASMTRWAETTSLGKGSFAGSTFSKIDEETVVLEMPVAQFTVLHMLADPGQAAVIAPKSTIDSANAEGLTEFIGTGPYKFVEWKSDQYVHLSKFEDYQSLDETASGLAGKKEAFIDDIYFQFVTDASTRLAGIQSGEYDIANAISFDNVEQLSTNTDVKNSIDHNGFNGIVFNKKAGLFQNVLARQAINTALNEEAILTAAFTSPDYYELEHGLMIKDQKEWYSEAGKDKYNLNDPEKAKAMLKEAGYNGEEIVILSTRDYEDHYNSAVVVQQQLESIGMKVKLDIYDWATVLQKRADETAYDIFVTGFPTEPIPNKYVFLDSSTEWPGWTNDPIIDDLLNKINTASSQDEAKQHFDALQEEFYEYLPMVKFGNKTTITTVRSNIEGMDFLQGIILWNVDKK